MRELGANPDDAVFYSLLAQSGYLSLECVDGGGYGAVKIPNKELAAVWKDFILLRSTNCAAADGKTAT